MDHVESPEENGTGGALWSTALAGALLTLISPLLFGAPGAISAGAGAALAVANLWAMARVVRGFLRTRGRQLSWGVIGLLKLGGLFVTVALLFRTGWVELLPLAFGYLAMPLGIVLVGLRGAEPREEEG
jgi:hypothetical protein